MLSITDFRDWYGDYCNRWPAVRDYELRHGPALADTWHQTLAGFDVDLLDRVTAGIIQGDFEPVENVKLGTFANEIRQRCRYLLDMDRRDRERQQSKTLRDRHHADFAPIQRGDLLHMMACGIAADQIQSELTGEPIVTDVRRYQRSGSVLPDNVYDAAIILADDHTAQEAEQAYTTLAAAGIDWADITARAEQLKRRGIGLVQEVGT